MTKVFINPGHCKGIDPGAVGPTGLKEVDVAIAIANELATMLNDLGIDTKTFQSDELWEVCDKANAYDADLFVSIHCNSFINSNAYGTEIFTSYGETQADKLATCIMDEVSSTFPDLYVRSDFSYGDVDKEAGFYVLKNTVMPAVLLETAFISNPEEELFLSKHFNQRLFAEAISRGIVNYLKSRG